MKKFLIIAGATLFLTGCSGGLLGGGSGEGRLGDGKLTMSDFSELARIYMSIQSGGGLGGLSGVLSGGVRGGGRTGPQSLEDAAAYLCGGMTVAEETAKGGSEWRKAACLAVTPTVVIE